MLDPGAAAAAKEALAIQAAEVGILARLKAGKTLDGIDTESGMDRPTS